LRFAGAFLQTPERLRPEHTESPRLRQMVVRRVACDVEQVEERLAVDRLRAEFLVRAACRRQLAKAHASRALTCSSTPARRRSCENGQLSSAFSNSVCKAASSTPSAATVASTCDATIWWPCPSTSSMT